MRCYLGLGSNQGDRAGLLIRALGLLVADGRVRLARVSPVYETAPVGYADQPDFLNMVVAVETDCSPEELLALTQGIEAQLGRERPFPNAPRTMDLDLLLCEGETRGTAELTLPHPRMRERQFVLAPLADIAPDLRLADSPPVAELVRAGDPDVKRLGPLADLLRSRG